MLLCYFILFFLLAGSQAAALINKFLVMALRFFYFLIFICFHMTRNFHLELLSWELWIFIIAILSCMWINIGYWYSNNRKLIYQVKEDMGWWLPKRFGYDFFLLFQFLFILFICVNPGNKHKKNKTLNNKNNVNRKYKIKILK